jgi:hypothetical protein
MRRGGKPVVAWIPPQADPAAAIAQALGVDPEDIIILEAAREAESAVEKRPWIKPTIAEEQLTPAEFSEITKPPQSRPKRAWRKPCVVDLPLEPPAAPEFRMRGREICIPAARDRRAKPLSFAAMLREDEGEGVLLTELACQSDWGPTHMLPQPGVH